MAFESALADYLDGTMSNAERAAFEQHAAGCVDCGAFMAEVSHGIGLLQQGKAAVEPPAELITRIAYLAPVGRAREPFEKETLFGRLKRQWLTPLLQPRLAMGMAMTILSFAMLERCSGIHVQHLQPADLNPVRVWGGVEEKALRVKDQVVKYYDNLRVVYEIESHLKDLEEPPAQRPPARAALASPSKSSLGKPSSGKQSSPSQGNQP